MNLAYFKDCYSPYIEHASQQTDLRALRVGDFPGEVVAVDGARH